jgi:hypothetical protein
MIKIPFDRCVIVTTLDFAQITDRLESAIYDPKFSSESHLNKTPNQQSYLGQIRGYKFSATRIVGHKYLHLPGFLFPTIEGDINSLHHGYEISLAIKLHNITFVLLLTWLGGLFTIIPSIFDNIFIGTRNYQYLTIVQAIALVYIATIAYFYLDAWQATKFFKTLFVKKFKSSIENPIVTTPTRDPDSQIPQTGGAPSPTDLLRKNLPSFPRHGDYPQTKK